MGTNNSMAKLLMKMWEGKRKNRDLPNKKTGFFFRQQYVMYIVKLYASQ